MNIKAPYATCSAGSVAPAATICSLAGIIRGTPCCSATADGRWLWAQSPSAAHFHLSPVAVLQTRCVQCLFSSPDVRPPPFSMTSARRAFCPPLRPDMLTSSPWNVGSLCSGSGTCGENEGSFSFSFSWLHPATHWMRASQLDGDR